MSRGFMGGFGGGGGDGKKSGFKASDFLKKKLIQKGGGASLGTSKYDGKPDYQESMKMRMEEYKKQMMAEVGSKNKVTLPGVDASQDFGMSDNAKKALEQLAMKKAKKEARRKRMKELAEQQMSKKIAGADGKKGKTFFGIEVGKSQPGSQHGRGGASPNNKPGYDDGSWSGTMWGQKDSWEGTMWAKKDNKNDWR